MLTELCTKRTKGDYERIVYLYIEKSKNELPYINDEDSCKLVLINSGSLVCEVEGQKKRLEYAAPSAIYLSNKDRIKVDEKAYFQATTVFFRPTVINDAFSYENLYQGKFENAEGTTTFQDYVVIRNFIYKDGHILKGFPLTLPSFENLSDLVGKMDLELREQRDGYWPCRSRSYLMEFLFSLNYCFDKAAYPVDFTASVIEYLNQHIDEKIDLERVTKEFHVNRNYLNQEFTSKHGMTCLSYLQKLRMDLACMWLSETGLPISEVGRRLGFLDQNYFTKVFRKEFGETPSEYRENRE